MDTFIILHSTVLIYFYLMYSFIYYSYTIYKYCIHTGLMYGTCVLRITSKFLHTHVCMCLCILYHSYIHTYTLKCRICTEYEYDCGRARMFLCIFYGYICKNEDIYKYLYNNILTFYIFFI